MNDQCRHLSSLQDKVIILTGGAGFLGKQFAKALSELGARVVVWDKKIGRLSDIKCEHACEVDITDEDQVKGEVLRIVNYYGQIDVLINNAAMNPAIGIDDSTKHFSSIEDYPVDLWRKEIEVNLTGMFICTKAVVPAMKKQGQGVIVNVSSVASIVTHDHRVYDEPGKYKSPAYVTSKTGVIGFTRACAAQLGEFGIRVNAFSPDTVRHDKMPDSFIKRFGATNMLGRVAEPDEYSETIIFLCSDASSFMTGANLIVDGGKSSW